MLTRLFGCGSDEDGCARDTPIACALLASLRRELPDIHVIRAEYRCDGLHVDAAWQSRSCGAFGGFAGPSVVEPHTWIQPHFGYTNAQLKFHVGLRVPKGPDGLPCAWMRVANETRSWAEGAALLFDDSFNHEVWNNCTATRAIFQLVVVHPDAVEASNTLADL
jgi:hypothetical protein